MSRADREEAYVEFVTARRAHLLRVAYALCGDWHRAEDLLQTALVKLYVAWPRVRRGSGPEPYVRTILVRANIDESRRPWRREQATEHLPEPAASTGLDVADRSELVSALQELPPSERAAVLLRHWLGLSVAETAESMGVREGTVKGYTSRGLEQLRLTVTPADSAR